MRRNKKKCRIKPTEKGIPLEELWGISKGKTMQGIEKETYKSHTGVVGLSRHCNWCVQCYTKLHILYTALYSRYKKCIVSKVACINTQMKQWLQQQDPGPYHWPTSRKITLNILNSITNKGCWGKIVYWSYPNWRPEYNRWPALLYRAYCCLVFCSM